MVFVLSPVTDNFMNFGKRHLNSHSKDVILQFTILLVPQNIEIF